jgi:DNA replication protein DnaC
MVATIGAQFARMAEEVLKERYSPLRYLEALLGAEIEEREHKAATRRIFEAKMPRVMTLEDFDFGQTPHISAARPRQLAEEVIFARPNRSCTLPQGRKTKDVIRMLIFVDTDTTG